MGLTVRGGRNTALIGLAAELPAAVLADLFAIDMITATRWARYAKRDWSAYLAARRDDVEQCTDQSVMPAGTPRWTVLSTRVELEIYYLLVGRYREQVIALVECDDRVSCAGYSSSRSAIGGRHGTA